MWQIDLGNVAIAVGSLIVGAVLMGMRDSFFKGTNSNRLKTVEESIKTLTEKSDAMEAEKTELTTAVGLLQQSLQLHVDRLEEYRDEHIRTIETVGKLNQTVTSLDATMKGLQSLLQNIFDGNLKIARP